jgi:hypothetical protein
LKVSGCGDNTVTEKNWSIYHSAYSVGVMVGHALMIGLSGSYILNYMGNEDEGMFQ